MERITQHEQFALSFSWDLQMLDEYDGIMSMQQSTRPPQLPQLTSYMLHPFLFFHFIFISFSFVGWILCEPQQSLCSRTRTFLLRYLEYEYTRCSPLQHLILHLKKDKRMNATSLVVRCLSAKKQKSTFPML